LSLSEALSALKEVGLGYPIENNPLEAFLLKKRELLFCEGDLYRALSGVEAGGETHRELLGELSEVQAKIVYIKNELNIISRNFDVFFSDAERKVARFEHDNPEPLAQTRCLHKKLAIRLKTYSNRSIHVVSQCLEWGSQVLCHKKESIVNWQNLSKFDEKLEEEVNYRIKKWHDDRTNIYLKAIGYAEVPRFNHDEFRRKYLSKHPTQLHPETCKHEETSLTKRSYQNGSSAVVNQCQFCGKHLNNVSKKSVPNLSDLIEFDEEKQKDVELNNLEHSRLMHKFMMEERKKFKVIRDEYLNSIPALPNKSRFGTYYNSEEWKRTRKRILERDNYGCQSCGEAAECVHHILYDRLGAENDVDLISLCHKCHTEVHSRQDLFNIQYRLTPNEILTLNEWVFVNEVVT